MVWYIPGICLVYTTPNFLIPGIAAVIGGQDYLGYEIDHDIQAGVLRVRQTAYATALLARYGFADCSPVIDLMMTILGPHQR